MTTLNGNIRKLASRSQTNGFTIIELLVVVSILSAVAYVALDALKEDTSQIRYDDTANRLTSIRQAILGRPDRTLMGEAEISGYVADMGALPTTIKDLLENPCTNVTTPADCEFEISNGIPIGWRGPYLNVMSIGGREEFRDGWGNVSTSDDSDNFGWDLDCLETGTTAFVDDCASITDLRENLRELKVISGGRNNLVDENDTFYDQDIEITMLSEDYLVQINSIDVTINNNSASNISGSFCLKIGVPSLDETVADEEYKFEASASAVVSGVSIPVGVSGGPYTFGFSGKSFPIGAKGVLLIHNVGSDCTSDDFPTDGYRSMTPISIRLVSRALPPSELSITIN